MYGTNSERIFLELTTGYMLPLVSLIKFSERGEVFVEFDISGSIINIVKHSYKWFNKEMHRTICLQYTRTKK